MTLKPIAALLGITLLLAACGQPARRGASQCLSALETSSTSSVVTTQSGPVAGYIDDGVYIYKGIPYGKADRFMPPVDPDPWKEVRPSRAFGPVSPHGERMGWRDDNQAFTMHWDDGFPGEDCLRVNVWTSSIKAGSKLPVMV